MDKIKVEPFELSSRCKQGTLNATFAEIMHAIGFMPNTTHLEDLDKTSASWGFIDDNGRFACVYNYESRVADYDCRTWSIYGSPGLLNDLFG